MDRSYGEEIVGYEHKEWTDTIQRFKYISDFALILFPIINPKIYIEGYSFEPKGQGAFSNRETVVFSNIDCKNKIFLMKWFECR